MATCTYRLAEYHVTNMLTNHRQYSAAVNNTYTGLIRLTGTYTLMLEDEGPLSYYL